MNKTDENYKSMFETITNGSKDLPYKSIKKIIKKLFIPILERDGFKINRDSMRRHGYLEYIASRGRGKH
tara:strand:- start:382 stop:588 length:207 start_codon:yes stop_codon:yes gene_type:complete